MRAPEGAHLLLEAVRYYPGELSPTCCIVVQLIFLGVLICIEELNHIPLSAAGARAIELALDKVALFLAHDTLPAQLSPDRRSPVHRRSGADRTA